MGTYLTLDKRLKQKRMFGVLSSGDLSNLLYIYMSNLVFLLYKEHHTVFVIQHIHHHSDCFVFFWCLTAAVFITCTQKIHKNVRNDQEEDAVPIFGALLH